MTGNQGNQDDNKVYDVIIVGGGVAGLTVAYRLKDKNILLLEKEHRPGGRTLSYKMGPYVYNAGAQIIPADDSNVAKLADEVEAKRILIKKTKIPIIMKGKLIARRYEPTFLWALPIPFLEKVKMGIKLTKIRWRYGSLVDQVPDPNDKKFQELDRETLADFVGAKHPDVKALWDTLCAGSNTVFSHEVAAYQPLNTFLHFRADEFYVEGGTQQLTINLHQRVKDKAILGAPVESVEQKDGLVHVTHEKDGQKVTVQGKKCVISAQGPLVLEMVKGLPDWKKDVLSSLDFGSMTSAGFLIGEPSENILGEGVWRVPIVGRPIVSVTNPSFTFPKSIKQETGQGLLRIYTGNKVSKELQQMSDGEALEFLSDELVEVLPRLKGKILESRVYHWPYAISPWRMGRLQQLKDIQAPTGNIHYCGDYTVSSGLESAMLSAYRVVEEVKERG